MRPRTRRTAVVAGCLLPPLLAVGAVGAVGAVDTVSPAQGPPVAAGGTGAAARAFPGENGAIAYVSDETGNDEVWTARPDGSEATQLTTTPGYESGPSWSPDGSALVVARSVDRGGPTRIVRVDRRGSGERVLTPDDGTYAFGPTWSPDGSRIAYTRSTASGTPQVWVVDAAGGTPQPLVSQYSSDPSWSPDGRTLAFTSAAGEEPARIWVADADGSDPRALTTAPATAEHTDAEWAPDGSRLVFTSRDADGDLDVWSVARDGTGPRPLAADDDTAASEPAYSPDGRSIAFTRRSRVVTGTGSAVWTMDAGGGDQAPVPGSTSTAFRREPAWQAAPRTVALTVDPTSAAREVGDDVTVTVTARDVLDEPVAGEAVLLRVTGAHPRGVVRTSDVDGTASYSWAGGTAGTDTLLACADLDRDGACGATEPAATTTVLWSLPPVTPPRLAFTDDADVLYAQQLRRVLDPDGGLAYEQVGRPFYATDGLTGFERGATHEGEASRVVGTSSVFVSTRDSPEGEIYRSASPPVRVTCDPGTETHPVADGQGDIAYASDADGDWDVYVASPPDGPGGCEDWTTVNVTDEPDGEPAYDDLWPTWTWDRTLAGPTVTGLVFSRAVEGELPDLWRAVRLPGGGPATLGPPTPVLETPRIAETQPAAMVQSVLVPDDDCFEGSCPPFVVNRRWVAYTTSAFRSSGSLAVLDLDDTNRRFPVQPDLRQASEPAWSAVVNPSHLAVTSRNEDPYGDIALAEVDAAALSAPDALADVRVSGFRTVPGSTAGVGQSHPMWFRAFGEDVDGEATLGYTSRAGEVESVSDGSRVLDADVSDVRWPDGTQRRVLRRERVLEDGEVVFRHDEAGPSYSPDGTQVVHSANTRPSKGPPEARVLVVSDADGRAAAPLLPASQRQPSDVDLDPAWSPDGDKVAFVRLRRTADGPGPFEAPAVWVYDLRTRLATRLGGSGADRFPDLSPSWSPDSRFLVVSRSDLDSRFAVADGARRWSSSPWERTPELYVLDVDDPTGPGLPFDYCSDDCSVAGRSPAWSPDGRTIAYETDGELLTIALDGACCAGPAVTADPPTPVVGFARSLTGEGDPVLTPTPPRTVVATAQDPTWSPDGTEIAFSGQPEGRPDAAGIYGVAPDGTGLRVITDEPGPESEPAYQPQPDEPEPEPTADLAVTVSVSGSPALVGAPVVATFTVTNDGPDPATDVVLLTAFPAGADRAAPAAPPGCRADGAGCDVAVLAPGASRKYAVRLRHATRVLGTATGSVASAVPDPDLLDNVDTALYRVQGADVRVRITVDEPVGYAGGRREATVTVRNAGTDPVDDVELTATWPTGVVPSVPPLGPGPPGPVTPPTPACLVAGDPCAIGTIGAGGRRRYRVTLGTPAEATVLLAAAVTTTTPETTLADNSDDVELQVLQPVLSLLPGVAPPGKVVLAYGEDLPPGSLVRLRWRRGITVDRRLVRVADDGTVRVPVLVVRHDLLGERALRAASRRRLFAPIRARLLVVPRTLVPPTFNGRG